MAAGTHRSRAAGGAGSVPARNACGAGPPRARHARSDGPAPAEAAEPRPPRTRSLSHLPAQGSRPPAVVADAGPRVLLAGEAAPEPAAHREPHESARWAPDRVRGRRWLGQEHAREPHRELAPLEARRARGLLRERRRTELVPACAVSAGAPADPGAAEGWEEKCRPASQPRPDDRACELGARARAREEAPAEAGLA